MKRMIPWLLIAVLAFSGCSSAQQTDPYRVDTVVRIPVDPTQAPTEEQTEPTEAPTEAPTEPKETAAPTTTTSYKGSSPGGKTTSSGKTQSSKNQKPKETKPPETIPPTEAPEKPPYDPSSYSVGNLEYGILDELNAYRAEEGLSELSISGRLSGIAYLRAMEASSLWSHTRPDGRSYTSALSDYGYGYGTVKELMVYVAGKGDAVSVAEKWINAKSSGETVLSDSFSTAGIGIYRTDGTTYVVCLLVG